MRNRTEGAMGIFSRTPKAGGAIGYFSLEEWWLGAFTAEERDYNEEKHKPMGESRDRPLTQGNITQTTQTAAGLYRPGRRHLV